MSSATGIPTRALDAYATTALRTAKETPGCKLSWNTLAAIGDIESGHGTHGGANLLADGDDSIRILGPALDGSNGTAAIINTDPAVDGDGHWARAVGPLQFLPSTWTQWGTDANGDGTADPNNIDDAALTAARYLCAAGGDLSTGSGWTDAIRAYNHDDSYVDQVRTTANAYAEEAG